MKLAEVICSCARSRAKFDWVYKDTNSLENDFYSNKYCQNLAFPGITTFAWQKCTIALKLKKLLLNVAKMYCLCDKMINC